MINVWTRGQMFNQLEYANVWTMSFHFQTQVRIARGLNTFSFSSQMAG